MQSCVDCQYVFQSSVGKSSKTKTRFMVVAVGQFVLLAVTLKVQIGVPATKGQEQTQVVVKKIALPFVYVRHFSQYCACERFDVHGQKLVFDSHHKPKLLPFFINMFLNRRSRFLYEPLKNYNDAFQAIINGPTKRILS
jgi:hypothetical protein